jgi:hypothetical protein
MVLLSALNFGGAKENLSELKITVPEDLDFEGIFDDILKEYTSFYELISTKTTNMGSLYDLTYNVSMKQGKSVKEMMDKMEEEDFRRGRRSNGQFM